MDRTLSSARLSLWLRRNMECELGLVIYNYWINAILTFYDQNERMRHYAFCVKLRQNCNEAAINGNGNVNISNAPPTVDRRRIT